MRNSSGTHRSMLSPPLLLRKPERDGVTRGRISVGDPLARSSGARACSEAGRRDSRAHHGRGRRVHCPFWKFTCLSANMMSSGGRRRCVRVDMVSPKDELAAPSAREAIMSSGRLRRPETRSIRERLLFAVARHGRFDQEAQNGVVRSPDRPTAMDFSWHWPSCRGMSRTRT